MSCRPYHSLRIPLLAAALLVAANIVGNVPAHAGGRLDARYKMTVAGIAMGRSELSVAINSTDYTIATSGRTSGVLRILVSGEGSLATRGAIVDGRLVPTSFTSSTTQEDEKAEVRMTLEGGVVTELFAQTTAAAADRVALTAEHRKGIVDPMTALLIAVCGTDDVLAREACERTLPIFDGRRRYDLKLAFKRMEIVKADKGYRGPAVVCGVTFHAIAGHRASSPLVKYLADGRDIELVLAPIAGTRVLAPFRLSVANMLGDLVIEAAEFETMPTMSIRAALPVDTAAR